MGAPSRIPISALVNPPTPPQLIERSDSTESNPSTTSFAAIEALKAMAAPLPVPPRPQPVYTQQNFDPLKYINYLHSIIHTAAKTPLESKDGGMIQYAFQDGSTIVRTSVNTYVYACKLADTIEYAMLIQTGQKVQYVNPPLGVPESYEDKSSFYQPYSPKPSTKDDRLAKAAPMMGVFRNLVDPATHS